MLYAAAAAAAFDQLRAVHAVSRTVGCSTTRYAPPGLPYREGKIGSSMFAAFSDDKFTICSSAENMQTFIDSQQRSEPVYVAVTESAPLFMMGEKVTSADFAACSSTEDIVADCYSAKRLPPDAVLSNHYSCTLHGNRVNAIKVVKCDVSLGELDQMYVQVADLQDADPEDSGPEDPPEADDLQDAVDNPQEADLEESAPESSPDVSSISAKLFGENFIEGTPKFFVDPQTGPEGSLKLLRVSCKGITSVKCSPTSTTASTTRFCRDKALAAMCSLGEFEHWWAAAVSESTDDDADTHSEYKEFLQSLSKEGFGPMCRVGELFVAVSENVWQLEQSSYDWKKLTQGRVVKSAPYYPFSTCAKPQPLPEVDTTVANLFGIGLGLSEQRFTAVEINRNTITLITTCHLTEGAYVVSQEDGRNEAQNLDAESSSKLESLLAKEVTKGDANGALSAGSAPWICKGKEKGGELLANFANKHALTMFYDTSKNPFRATTCTESSEYNRFLELLSSDAQGKSVFAAVPASWISSPKDGVYLLDMIQ
jgi:hypothetical protein